MIDTKSIYEMGIDELRAELALAETRSHSIRKLIEKIEGATSQYRNVKEVIISIDRPSKSIAVFEDPSQEMMRDFLPYTDEQKGLEDATQWVKANTDDAAVRLIYPNISSMRTSTVRARRSRV